MRSSPRIALSVLVMAGASAIMVFTFRPDIDADPTAAFEVVSLPDDGTDARLAEVGRRMAVKLALASDLVAGRSKLTDVAARFAELDTDRPPITVFERYYPGLTVRERYYRVVLAYVEMALDRDPRREQVLARLEAELAAVVAAGD